MVSLKANSKKEEKENEPAVIVEPLPPDYRVVEEYWVKEPYAKAVIAESIRTGELKYFALEEPLRKDELSLYEKIVSFLEREVDPPDDPEVDRTEFVVKEAGKLIRKYKRLRPASEESKNRILYHVARDVAGFGYIHVLMLDPHIEDISCNGVRTPIYIWHRKYESLPTNITFVSERVLDDFIVKLAHMSGRHISSAHPILDATLPGKHRLAATFMHEVSTSGSTFCIRKFREVPFSIVDLVNMGTLNDLIAAYLWVLVENKMSIMILGGTGAGKTTTLNAVASLIRPEMKIVTVEETAEINLPHENWVQFISREEFGFSGAKARSITLFDLVKTSLRYRPDYIIVGEIRGEEAYVLFQALATGHGGMSTMHADSLDYAIKRLTSPPMNISKIYLPLMNTWMHIERITITKGGKTKSVRRIRTVWELDDNGEYRVIAEWLPDDNVFLVDLNNSFLIEKIARKKGIGKGDVLREIERRRQFINLLLREGVTSYRAVASSIREYYKRVSYVKREVTSIEMLTILSRAKKATGVSAR